MTSALIHVGYPKTGSTWLQGKVFPAIEGATFLKKSHPLVRPLMANLLEAADREFKGATFSSFVAEMTGGRPDCRLIVSDERLIENAERHGRSAFRTAVRLRDLFPDARILIVVRHQVGMIRSSYFQYVHEGGYLSFQRFLAGEDGFDPESLEYHRFVGAYQAHFGWDNVLVLPFELLQTDRQAFLTQIFGFASEEPPDLSDPTTDQPSNPSLSPVSRELLRVWNRLFRRTIYGPRPMLFGVPGAGHARGIMQRSIDPVFFQHVPRVLRQKDERRLLGMGERYAESNVLLESMAKVDIRRFGYPVPDQTSRTAR